MKRRLLEKKGQNIIEYVLVFTVIIMAVFFLLRPNGIITKKTELALDMSMTGIGCIVQDVCYEADGKCNWVCGNGCCERGLGETSNNCSRDCSPLCGNNVKEVTEECDDGNTTSGDGCSRFCQNES